MSNKTRRQFDGKFKRQVVLAALQKQKSLRDLCREFDLHPNQILEWKRHVLSTLQKFLIKPKFYNLTAYKTAPASSLS